MVTLANHIILEILELIYRKGGNPNIWYVGITNEPSQRLFDEHTRRYQNDAWIYRTVESEGEALQVQSYFLEFGLAEDEEGWQPGACAVYAYRKHAVRLPVRSLRTKLRKNGNGRRCSILPAVHES